MDPTEYVIDLNIQDLQRLKNLIQNFCNIKQDFQLPFLKNVRKKLVDKKGNTNLKKLRKLKMEKIPLYLLNNQSSTKYRQVHTLNGIKFDIAKSAVQKYIRRGLWVQAQRIGAEMDLFKWITKGKGSVTNFYNRIRIIVLEDIGIAIPIVLIHCKPYNSFTDDK